MPELLSDWFYRAQSMELFFFYKSALLVLAISGFGVKHDCLCFHVFSIGPNLTLFSFIALRLLSFVTCGGRYSPSACPACQITGRGLFYKAAQAWSITFLIFFTTFH